MSAKSEMSNSCMCFELPTHFPLIELQTIRKDFLKGNLLRKIHFYMV